MTPKQFSVAWSEVSNYTDRDAYISDLVLSSMWGDAPESDIPDDRICALGRIWDAARMTPSGLVKASGLTRAAFADLYGISYDTLTKWCLGSRPMPNHVHVMLARLLGLI